MLFSTAKMFVSSFAWHFNTNDLPDLTKSNHFKRYIKALKLEFVGGTPINRKKPILSEHLENYAKALNSKEISKLEITKMTIYSLMWFGFLRVSELTNLKFKDISIEENKTICLSLVQTKNDPDGYGIVTYIPYQESCIIHPYSWLIQYINLHSFSNDDRVFPYSTITIERYAKFLAKFNNLDECEYSSHSFRRGGAYTASARGVQDCQIQKHGR